MEVENDAALDENNRLMEELPKRKAIEWLPFALWILGCLIFGVLISVMLGFFKSDSFVRTNATFLYLGFIFLGLLLGIYIGISRTPAVQGVVSSLLVFIGGLIIIGGATIFISDMYVSQQQAIGMCFSCLGAYTIIGAAMGLIIKTQSPSLSRDIRDKYLYLSMLLLELTHQYEVESDNTRKERLKGDIAILQRVLSSTPVEDTGSEIGFRRIQG